MQIGQQPSLTQQTTQVATTSISISHKLITSLNILQRSSLELEQDIAREVRENPALEAEDVPLCSCGAPLREGLCPQCGLRAQVAPRVGETAEWGEGNDHSLLGGDDDEFDPMARVSNGETLEEYLLQAVCAQIAPEEVRIAEAIVGNLDEHGYLAATLDELAADLDVSREQVEVVLAILQAQEPLGIGARDLRECLLIQLRWFREQEQPQPLAERIVDGYLRDVAERRFIEIGRELGTTSTHVRRAWDFIKANLNPYPAHEALAGLNLRGNSRGTTALVRPDVIIRRTEIGFEAEVVEGRRFQMKISPTYQIVARHPGNCTDAERKHIQKYVSQAQFFIDCIHQRWATLKKIADALIEVQYEFLDRGVRYLRPLTRSELAIYVGLHEATISRATNDKYVLLPEGRTIPFDDFFNASLRAKDTLRELIAAENPRKPLSDEDLAEQLTERGMPVARRTVAKYREALRILPSRLR